jgi:hypothetical protein
MDLLVMLDKSQATGKIWTSIPGTVFEKDVRDWAIEHELIEANTIDGEPTVYRITGAGQLAMVKDETPTDEARSPKLKADMVKFLTLLAESKDWVLSQSLSLAEYPYYLRQTVQRRGYVEGRGNNAQREFKITAEGLSVLGNRARLTDLSAEEKQRIIDDSKARIRSQIKTPPLSIPSIESNDITIQNVSIDDGLSVQEAASAAADFAVSISEQIRNIPKEIAVKTPRAPIAIDDCGDNCATCVYREVVELLETRVDGVSDLVAGLKAINKRK